MLYYSHGLRLLAGLSALAAFFVSGGCGSSYVKVTDSMSKPDVTLNSSVHSSYSGPLVLIRYPARLAVANEAQLRTAWSDHPWTRGCSRSESDANLDETMTFTSFYVNELREAVESQIGVGRVILQPMEVSVASGRATLVYPSLSSRAPDAPLTIDFWCMGNGRTAWPMVVMALKAETDRRTEVFTNYPYVNSENDFAALFDSWIESRWTERQISASNIRRQRPGNASRLLVIKDYPVYVLRHRSFVDYDVVGELHDLEFRPFHPLWRKWANIATEILNDSASDESRNLALQSYAAGVDPEWPKELNDANPGRLVLISEFLAAERRILADMDARFVLRSYYGRLGTSVRQLRYAQYQHEQAVQSASQQSSLVGMAAMLGAASTFYAQGTGAISTSQATSNIMQLNIYNSQVQASTDATVRELQREYAMYMDRVLPEAVEVKIQLDEGDETLRVSSLKELREKFRIIYARKFGNR